MEGAQHSLATLHSQAHPWFRGIDWENIHKYPAPYRPELRNPEDTRHFDDDIPAEVRLPCTRHVFSPLTTLTPRTATRASQRRSGGRDSRSAASRQGSRRRDPRGPQGTGICRFHAQEPAGCQLRPSGQSVRSGARHLWSGRTCAGPVDDPRRSPRRCKGTSDFPVRCRAARPPTRAMPRNALCDRRCVPIPRYPFEEASDYDLLRLFYDILDS